MRWPPVTVGQLAYSLLHMSKHLPVLSHRFTRQKAEAERNDRATEQSVYGHKLLVRVWSCSEGSIDEHGVALGENSSIAVGHENSQPPIVVQVRQMTAISPGQCPLALNNDVMLGSWYWR